MTNVINITISGPPGIGKTGLAAAICVMLAQKGLVAYVIDDSSSFPKRGTTEARLRTIRDADTQIEIVTASTPVRVPSNMHEYENEKECDDDMANND